MACAPGRPRLASSPVLFDAGDVAEDVGDVLFGEGDGDAVVVVHGVGGLVEFILGDAGGFNNLLLWSAMQLWWPLCNDLPHPGLLPKEKENRSPPL